MKEFKKGAVTVFCKGEIVEAWVDDNQDPLECRGTKCKTIIIFGHLSKDGEPYMRDPSTGIHDNGQPLVLADNNLTDYKWHFEDCINADEFRYGRHKKLK